MPGYNDAAKKAKQYPKKASKGGTKKKEISDAIELDV